MSLSEDIHIYRVGLQPPEGAGYKLVTAMTDDQAVKIANLGLAPVSLIGPTAAGMEERVVIEDHSIVDYAIYSEKFIKEHSKPA